MQKVITRLALAMLPFLFFQCSSETPDANGEVAQAMAVDNPPAAKLPSYQTLKVSPTNEAQGLILTGRVQPLEAMAIVPEVPGRTLPTKTLFNEGVTFQKGALMVSIDDQQARLDLQALRAQFKSALVRIMSTVKLDYPSAYPVWDKYLVDFDEKKTLPDLPKISDQQLDYFLSVNNVQSTFYQIKSGEEQLQKFKLYAPFTGVLTQSSFSPGAVVGPGVPLGQFSRTDVYEYKTSVSAADIDQVKVGQNMEIRSRANNQKWTGTVHRIGQSIDPASQNVPVFIQVSGKGLRSGLFLETTLSNATFQGVTRLPRHAITRTNEVHVIENSVVKIKPVEVVEYDGDDVLVKGLAAGDQVIIEKLNGPIAGKKVVAEGD